MNETSPDLDVGAGTWKKVDARILGQILAAQNLLSVLPDEEHVAEFFTEVLHGIPGMSSSFVCMRGFRPPGTGVEDVCAICGFTSVHTESRFGEGNPVSCGLASRPEMMLLQIAAHDSLFGYFVIPVVGRDHYEPYIPFLHNLANFVALTMENRNQRRALEQARDELEAFTYSVSHDLRTPLRGIDGFSQLLLDQYQAQLDQRGKDYLARVRSASMRMAELIEDLLNLSRVSRSDMHIQQVDLSQIAREIGTEFQRAHPERHVTLLVGEKVLGRGDGRLLRIALENLLENAWKYTSKHPTATIEFGMRRVRGQPAYYVSDDGAGFDMQYKDKLFTAFQRLHSSAEFPGIGIGLATVQRIIHRHGGEVWAEGEVEKGAVFYFSLPQ
jgi:signal transduction histidine kinase